MYVYNMSITNSMLSALSKGPDRSAASKHCHPLSNLQTSKLETMSLDFVVTFVRMCSFDLLCHPYINQLINQCYWLLVLHVAWHKVVSVCH